MQMLAAYRLELDIITKYMLEDRFKSATKRGAEQDPLRLKDKSTKKHYSVDMLAYLDMLPEPKEKEVPINILDVLKFYKTLEVFILKRQWVASIDELELGSLTKHAKAVTSILPKIFLVANCLPLQVKKLFLNYIFSSVVIYRQFKVKSTPEIDSIVGPYTGSPIDTLLTSEFSKIQIGE